MSFKPFENLNNENEDIKKANLLLMIFFTLTALAAMIFVPFAGFAGLAFIPVPATLLFLSNRYRDAIICAITGLLILFVFNYVLAIMLLVMICAVAINYKYIINRNKKLSYSLPTIFALFVIALLLFLIIDSVILKLNVVKEMLTTYNRYVDNLNQDPLLKDYQSLFFSDSAQLNEVMSQTQGFLKYVPALVPGFAVVFFGLSAVLNYCFSFVFLKKHNIKLESMPPFKDWDLSWNYCWGFIAGIIFLIIPKFNPVYDGIIDAIGYNLIIVFGLLYMILGTAVLWGLLDRFNVRVSVRVIIIVATFLLFGFGVVLPLVGLIDIWVNFRKLGRGL
jgi:uncharacterized protein YybS (DUF2232 family)